MVLTRRSLHTLPQLGGLFGCQQKQPAGASLVSEQQLGLSAHPFPGWMCTGRAGEGLLHVLRGSARQRSITVSAQANP